MINFNEFLLNEIFDEPYRIRKTTFSRKDAIFFVFETTRGHEGDINFHELEPGHWLLSFEVNGDFIRTGKGDAFRIMATVLVAIKEFLRIVKRSRIKQLDFAALHEDGSMSRANLYYKMLKKFSKQYNFIFDRVFIDNYYRRGPATLFTLYNNDIETHA